MKNPIKILTLFLLLSSILSAQTFTTDYFIHAIDADHSMISEISVGKVECKTSSGKIELASNKEGLIEIRWYKLGENQPNEIMYLQSYEYNDSEYLIDSRCYDIEEENKIYDILFDQDKNVFLLNGNNGYGVYSGDVSYVKSDE